MLISEIMYPCLYFPKKDNNIHVFSDEKTYNSDMTVRLLTTKVEVHC